MTPSRRTPPLISLARCGQLLSSQSRTTLLLGALITGPNSYCTFVWLVLQNSVERKLALGHFIAAFALQVWEKLKPGKKNCSAAYLAVTAKEKARLEENRSSVMRG
jgi:hypothetical protein